MSSLSTRWQFASWIYLLLLTFFDILNYFERVLNQDSRSTIISSPDCFQTRGQEHAQSWLRSVSLKSSDFDSYVLRFQSKQQQQKEQRPFSLSWGSSAGSVFLKLSSAASRQVAVKVKLDLDGATFCTTRCRREQSAYYQRSTHPFHLISCTLRSFLRSISNPTEDIGPRCAT